MARFNIGLVIALFAVSALGNAPAAVSADVVSTDDQSPLTREPVEVVAGTSPPVTTAPPATDVIPDSRITNHESEISREEPSDPAPIAATTPPMPPDDAGLYRLRMCESTGNYGAHLVSGTSFESTVRGAYQFLRSTWNDVASRWAPQLVGVDPAAAAPADQDYMARALWSEAGGKPWPVCRYRV